MGGGLRWCKKTYFLFLVLMTAPFPGLTLWDQFSFVYFFFQLLAFSSSRNRFVKFPPRDGQPGASAPTSPFEHQPPTPPMSPHASRKSLEVHPKSWGVWMERPLHAAQSEDPVCSPSLSPATGRKPQAGTSSPSSLLSLPVAHPRVLAGARFLTVCGHDPTAQLAHHHPSPKH